MGKLITFNFVTLNGYFKGPGEDISWNKDNDPEKSAYALEGLKSKSTLLFGRRTYEMMASFWPTPDAQKFAPAMAEGMNMAEKIVFSTTLKKAEWNNTRIIKDNIVEEVKKMKQEPGRNMTILGSGSIITRFAEKGLIDEYQIMIDPLALGDGTPLFKGISSRLDLKLTSSRIFKSGAVLLCYAPAAR